MLHARKSYVTVARIRNKIEESRVRVMLASYVRKVHIAHYNTSHTPINTQIHNDASSIHTRKCTDNM